MYYDYHMHCDFSRDSKTPMEDMIRKSIDLKLSEICFTDHSDYSILVNNIEQDHDPSDHWGPDADHIALRRTAFSDVFEYSFRDGVFRDRNRAGRIHGHLCQL